MEAAIWRLIVRVVQGEDAMQQLRDLKSSYVDIKNIHTTAELGLDWFSFLATSVPSSILQIEAVNKDSTEEKQWQRHGNDMLAENSECLASADAV